MGSTKELILDAASRLIHVRGFNNTSVDDILRESGVGKGNFYYYFKSKDELGFAILDRSAERIREEFIEKCFASTADPWVQLQGFLEFSVERARKQGFTGGCPLGNLAVEMSDIHEEFRQRLIKAFDEIRTRIELSLKQAKDEGTLRADADIPRLAHFVIAGFEGALMMGKLRKDPDVVAGVIEELKEHLTLYRVALSPMTHV
ncbi:MAG TPA: TetR family transcriptional regulator C-terminal domain-containing protein [Candidatus Methylomirabilis sp.]|nr:TetR family transcriptional regulator C-terminal domain-containing protein [Candidatus Methylomirabilis sp.]HSB79856.1 TetR family transcriptional regulator C-terminal domain-containing protein [Candidatus Methylomirabilis sp.]HSC72281.1 TetR family transcriptional regulator C-terminal domain-containing protein [Candidatus Methylomirabilis sp.]